MIELDYGLERSRLCTFANEDEWVENRHGSIGSSEMAILLNMGYANTSEYALWAQKVHGMEPEFKESQLKMFKKGKLAEPYIASLLQLEHGWQVMSDPLHSFRRSIDDPHLSASLDGWMLEGSKHCVLEYKNISSWGADTEWDTKSKRAPIKYTIQVQHQLAVTGWEKGYLVALNGLDVKVFEVPRHEPLIEQMRQIAREFWTRVVTKQEPPVDDSDATRLALQSVYKKEPMEVHHCDDEQSALIDMVIELEESVVRDTEMLERHRNELLRVTGGAERLVTSDKQWFIFKGRGNGKRRLKRA